MKKIKGNKKNLAFPVIALAAASFLLLVILGVITYLNYNHNKKLLREQLLQEGLSIIRSTEAGARTGMMEMMWGENQIQTLIQETAKGPNITGIQLLDKNGKIVASSNLAQVGLLRSNFKVPKNKSTVISKIVKEKNGMEIFQIVKQFEPMKYNPNISKSMSGMMGGMMGSSNNSSIQKTQYIVLNLSMEEYKNAQADDIRRAVISAIILLVIGSASFYFLFILQSYYVTNNALKNMESYTQNVVESMPNGLFSINKEGKIETANRYAADLLKLNHSELKGKTLKQILPKCDFDKIHSSSKAFIEQQMNCRLNDNSTVPLSVTFSNLNDQNGADIGSVIIFRDLREIRLLEKKIERSERLASLGRMAAGIAHEIRNPLSSIKGFAQFFKSKFKSNSEEWNYAGVMIGEVDRLDRVIRDLLNFAKPQEPSFKKQDITELLEHSLKLIQPEINEKKIEVIKNFNSNLPFINIDGDLITQAFLNLFLNAAQAMDGGGKLSISTSLKDGNIKIEISDNGTGIPKENLSRIFDPFFTSKKGGTGLGLALVYRIIENHNGKIEVESEPGKGTVFTILLPGGEV